MKIAFCNVVRPTAAAGVRYDEWLRFVLLRYLALIALGGIAIVVGVAIGLQ